VSQIWNDVAGSFFLAELLELSYTMREQVEASRTYFILRPDFAELHKNSDLLFDSSLCSCACPFSQHATHTLSDSGTTPYDHLVYPLEERVGKERKQLSIRHLLQQ